MNEANLLLLMGIQKLEDVFSASREGSPSQSMTRSWPGASLQDPRYRLELCAAAAILLTPPPIVNDRRAAAADRVSASRRRRFRDVFTSCCKL